MPKESSEMHIIFEKAINNYFNENLPQEMCVPARLEQTARHFGCSLRKCAECNLNLYRLRVRLGKIARGAAP